MGLLSSPSQLNFSILLYGSLKKKKKKGIAALKLKTQNQPSIRN